MSEKDKESKPEGGEALHLDNMLDPEECDHAKRASHDYLPDDNPFNPYPLESNTNFNAEDEVMRSILGKTENTKLFHHDTYGKGKKQRP